MAIKYRVVAVTGTYEKDGKTKNEYAQIGDVIETRNGLMLKIKAIPLNWQGTAYLNEPEERRSQKPADTGSEDPF